MEWDNKFNLADQYLKVFQMVLNNAENTKSRNFNVCNTKTGWWASKLWEAESNTLLYYRNSQRSEGTDMYYKAPRGKHRTKYFWNLFDHGRFCQWQSSQSRVFLNSISVFIKTRHVHSLSQPVPTGFIYEEDQSSLPRLSPPSCRAFHKKLHSILLATSGIYLHYF